MDPFTTLLLVAVIGNYETNVNTGMEVNQYLSEQEIVNETVDADSLLLKKIELLKEFFDYDDGRIEGGPDPNIPKNKVQFIKIFDYFGGDTIVVVYDIPPKFSPSPFIETEIDSSYEHFMKSMGLEEKNLDDQTKEFFQLNYVDLSDNTVISNKEGDIYIEIYDKDNNVNYEAIIGSSFDGSRELRVHVIIPRKWGLYIESKQKLYGDAVFSSPPGEGAIKVPCAPLGYIIKGDRDNWLYVKILKSQEALEMLENIYETERELYPAFPYKPIIDIQDLK